MSLEQEQQAENYLDEASKMMKGSKRFFSKLFGSADSVDDVCDLYVKAANCYKVAQNWHRAGEVFVDAAKLKFNNGQKHEAASHYVDAGLCFKKVDNEAAINAYTRGAEIFTDMGRFCMAAKHLIHVAEIYEEKTNNLEKAMEVYSKAAAFYKGEDSISAANKCTLKVAHFAAELQDYQKAISLFEEVASYSLDHKLLKYSAKDYYFKAGICALCIDFVNAQTALSKYCDLHPAFKDSREYKLLDGLTKAVETDNIDEYTVEVTNYDKISRIDKWVTCLLLRIKKGLTASTTNPFTSSDQPQQDVTHDMEDTEDWT